MARNDIPPKGGMARLPLHWLTVVLRSQLRMDTKALNLHYTYIISDALEV